MNGSYNFYLHLLSFALLAGTFIPSFILDRKFRAEKDWGRKLYIGGIMKTFGMFAPINIALLLLTGLGNMYNRFLGAPYPWYEETWLVIKLACFVVMASNGMFVGKKIGMKRVLLVKAIVERNAPADADQQVARYDKKISVVMFVQLVLLLTIVLLSAFGTGKHPGQF